MARYTPRLVFSIDPARCRNTFAHAVRFPKVVWRPLGNISFESSWLSFTLSVMRFRSSEADISPSAVAISTGSISDWKPGTGTSISPGTAFIVTQVSDEIDFRKVDTRQVLFRCSVSQSRDGSYQRPQTVRSS